MISIRPYTRDDFDAVASLLDRSCVEPPEDHGCLEGGPCYVAERDGEVVGVVYAMHGGGTRAYVDYLAVDPSARWSTLLLRLLNTIEDDLKARGARRYVFHIEKYNSHAIKMLFRRRASHRITKLRDLHYFSRELSQ